MTACVQAGLPPTASAPMATSRSSGRLTIRCRVVAEAENIGGTGVLQVFASADPSWKCITLSSEMSVNEMKPILVLFAHPAVRRSRVNRRLLSEAQSVEKVTVHDLYEAYPDFGIDVAREQELLSQHDVVVLQHPFYWYSTPAILKEWQDLVLEHGWAYGHEGRELSGKLLLSAVSTGGAEETYCRRGSNRFSMSELLAPIAQMASLCGMEYLPPFVVHGTHSLVDGDLDRHAENYRRVLEGLRDARLDIAAARTMPRINSDLDRVLENEGCGAR